MVRLWKTFIPIVVGAISLAVMLFLFGVAPLRAIFGSEAVSALAIAPAVAPEALAAQKGLPAERAEMYRTLLQKLARTAPDAVAPSEESFLQEARLKLGVGASVNEIQAAAAQYAEEFHHKHSKAGGANPMAYVGRLKAKEMARAAGDQSVAALSGNPEVLTVMMNFTGVETYTTSDAVAYNTHCLTDTAYYTPGFQIVIDGPRFNEIPEPTDRSVPWLDPATSPTGGFTKAYYELMMYSTTGDTSIMRPDVYNPWTGGFGYDFSGVSFRNYYHEISRGIYTPQGKVYEVSIPEAVSHFGAARCNGVYQDDEYREPYYSFVISAAEQINLQYPGAAVGTNSEFKWADWDKEDAYDYDNDGNFNEPDGYVDHFFLIEAGQKQGYPYGEFQIWPHSSQVDAFDPGVGPVGNQIGGYQVAADPSLPFGGMWVWNYTVSDENGGLGVLAHEYGHDIGMPDNYGTDGSGPNPGFWDLMDSGGYGGGLAGMMPVNMTIWDKEFFGWNKPVEIDLANAAAVGKANAADFTIGQQSKPPAGTVDGLHIDLPDVLVESPVTPFDEHMWWSDRGDSRDESIERDFTLKTGETATVTAKMAYFVEQDYDYLYWEISNTVSDGWVPLAVFSGTTELTTDDDPNEANPSGNGMTGSSGDEWIVSTATITPDMHAAGVTAFRFRYVTDGFVQEQGVFLDNISIAGTLSGPLFSDDAEGGDQWSHESQGLNTESPWRIFDGKQSHANYYLVEWRNSGEPTGANGNSDTAKAFDIAGFDSGLNRMYWRSRVDQYGNFLRADPLSMHTPGMVIWYVNDRYGSNDIGGNYFDSPSPGAQGHVLVVDANPYPFTIADPAAGPRLLTERRSAFDGAFTLNDRPAFTLTSDLSNTGTLSITTIPGALAKPAFHDRIGAAPGFTGAPADVAALDLDAGVVLPSKESNPYAPAWDFYRDTGNPGLEALGINLEVLDQAKDGTWGKVRFWLDNDTIFFDKRANVKTALPDQVVTFTITLKDASGTRYEDDRNYTYPATMTDHLPDGATYVAKSLKVIDGPWTTKPSVVAINDSTITWHGVLGGNPLATPDATIQYKVKIGVTQGAVANSATLEVVPQLISTDTFSETLETPYLWPKQTKYIASAQVEVGGRGNTYLPGIHK